MKKVCVVRHKKMLRNHLTRQPWSDTILRMEITTTTNTVSVNCAGSSALESLVLVDDSIVVARFKSNPHQTYIYTVAEGNLLATLAKYDSAGKFVSLFVKPMAKMVVKKYADGEAVMV